jgi:glycogen debranching enzyme
LYVAALVRAGHLEEASHVLELLAQTNKEGRDHEWEFNEWFHGVSGKPSGSPDQGWSAGMYMYAYNCVKEGREPVFSTIELNDSRLSHNINPHDA